MGKKIFLFDFDGTLAESMTTIVSIFNKLADTYKLPRKIKKEDIPQLRKLNLHQIIQVFKIPPLKIPFLLYAGRKLFTQQIYSLKPIDGIQPTLRLLKQQGFTLGIATSNTVSNVEIFLKNNDLEVFDFIHSEKGLFGKDKIIKNIIKTYKLPIENTFYVGDEIRDIEAARKAGLKIISVTWGANTKEALEKANPDFLINSPAELLQFE